MAPAWQARPTRQAVPHGVAAARSSLSRTYPASVSVDHSTTTDVPEAPVSARARWLSRIGRLVLVLFVVAGAVGLLGPRSGKTSAEGAGYELHVSHAAVTRAGQPMPLHIQVEHPGGFDGPVRLALCDEFFDDLDFQAWYPTPSAETGTADELVYEFDPPPGDVLEVSLDARSAPGQFGEVERCSVAVLEGDARVAEAAFDTWRMP